jgi:hypothetical protein
MNWEYGKAMLKDGQIESLDNWSDLKEEVISKMDNYYDYVWWEDKNGFYFVDRFYYDYGDWITSGYVEQRRKNNELKMYFKTIEEVKEWIDKKEKSKEMN